MFVIRKINGEDSAIHQIAVWHNQTPKQWDATFIATDENIQKTIERIKNTTEDVLYLAVAEDCGLAPQGFIWAYKMADQPGQVMILSLYTAPLFRGQGVATALKNSLEDWCRAQQIHTIQTTVHYENTPMIALNKQMGYIPGMVTMTKRLG